MGSGGCINLAHAFDQTGFVHRPDLIQYDLARFSLESNRDTGGVGAALGGHGGDDDGIDMLVHFVRGNDEAWAVLRISRPSVGSRRTRKTSNREATTSSFSDPTERSMVHHDR